MFRNAYAIARQYTWPVVLSRKTIAGKCSSSIGAFVVVNEDGWIVTANHIIEQFKALREGDQKARAIEAQRAAIERNESLDRKERRRRLSRLAKPAKTETDRGSAWWGRDGCQLVTAAGTAAADVAVGRLEPFDPTWVTNYPMFKNPSKEFAPGVSLCKLGFPFYKIEPKWDSDQGAFQLPPAAFPLPLFPIDGILTRIVNIQLSEAPQSAPLPYPLRMIETSTPGLRGQSGGPIFDADGTIWGIQCHTMHYPLGFDPRVPESQRGEREHQFLNVGMGAHPATIVGIFRELDVEFRISD